MATHVYVQALAPCDRAQFTLVLPAGVSRLLFDGSNTKQFKVWTPNELGKSNVEY